MAGSTLATDSREQTKGVVRRSEGAVLWRHAPSSRGSWVRGCQGSRHDSRSQAMPGPALRASAAGGPPPREQGSRHNAHRPARVDLRDPPASDPLFGPARQRAHQLGASRTSHAAPPHPGGLQAPPARGLRFAQPHRVRDDPARPAPGPGARRRQSVVRGAQSCSQQSVVSKQGVAAN